MTKTPLLGIPFDDGGLHEAAAEALRLIDRHEGSYAVTPNPEIVLAARRDPALREAILSADLILPDGVGLVYASHIAGKALRHRIPGIDLADVLLAELAQRKRSVFLFGAAPGVAEEAARMLQKQFPGIKIGGTRHGYYTAGEEPGILAEIRRVEPDLLLVCLGSPNQELWMKKQARRLPVGLMIGLGGAMDVYAGKLRRAPERWRRLGLEWLFRLLQEPRRIRRMIRLPLILWAAYRERIGRV